MPVSAAPGPLRFPAGREEGEGGAGAKAKEKPRVKGVPNDLMDQIEKGQQSGGRSRKGRRRD